MKAIILLVAILAFASAKLNTQEFYTAFTEELEFTQEQHKELLSCAVELSKTVKTYLAPGKAALKAKLLGLFFASDAQHRQALVAVSQFVQKELPACRQFAHSFGSMLSEVGLTEEEKHISPNRLVNYRLKKYASFIISSVVGLYDDVKQGRSADAGVSAAYILEILTGMDRPETAMDYARDYKQPIEVAVIEKERFLHQAINTAVKELGFTQEVSIHRIKDLIEAVQGFVVAHMGTQMQLRRTNSAVEKNIILLGAARDLVKISAVIGENVKLILAPYVQSHHLASRGNALKLVKKLVHNYYLNLPYIQSKAVDFVMGVKAHHPTQTGHAVARIVELLNGNYHNNGFN